MQALCISDVYHQLNYYQSQYSHILQTPELFNLPVQEAYSHVWPFSKKLLCLGELLILWQSQKWKISDHSYTLWNVFFGPQESNKQDILLYQVEQETLFSAATAKGFLIETGESIEFELTGAWRYAVYQMTSKPCTLPLELNCA